MSLISFLAVSENARQLRNRTSHQDAQLRANLRRNEVMMNGMVRSSSYVVEETGKQ